MSSISVVLVLRVTLSFWGIEPEIVIRTHQIPGNCVVFSPDGRQLASCAGRFVGLLQDPRPGEVSLIDAKSGQICTRMEAHRDGVSAVCFSPDGEHIATAGFDGSVIVWRSKDMKLVRELPNKDAAALCLSYSSDGTLIAVGRWGAENNRVTLYDLTGPAKPRVLQRHTDGVCSVSFSPDDGLVASGAMDELEGCVKVWSRAAEKESFDVQLHWWPYALMFLRHGERLVVGGGLPHQRIGRLEMFDLKKSRSVLSVSQPDGMVSCLAIITGANLCVCGTYSGKIRLIKLSDGSTASVLQAHTHRVNGIALSRDGSRLASIDVDGIVKVWRVTDLLENRQNVLGRGTKGRGKKQPFD